MKKRSIDWRWPALLAALVLVIGLAACGGGDDGQATADSGDGGQSEDPIQIGSTVDLTGFGAAYDRGVRAGIEAAVAQVNANGGVLDRQIEVTFEDNGGDPQKGVIATRKILDQQQPVAFLSGLVAAVTSAIDPVLTQSEVPMIAGSVIPEETEFSYSTIVPPSMMNGVQAEYVVDQGLKKIAVLYAPTPYNELQLEVLEGLSDEMGLTITGVAEHETDAVDMRTQINTLMSKDPDVVIKLSGGPTTIVAAKAMDAVGAGVPLLMGIEDGATMADATKAYDQVLYVAAPPVVYDDLGEDEKTEALDALMADAPEGEDLTYVGRGFDAVMLLVNAMEEAGEVSGPAIRQALEDMGPYDGTSAVYDYTPEDHYGLTSNPLMIGSIGDDGIAKVVFRPAS